MITVLIAGVLAIGVIPPQLGAQEQSAGPARSPGQEQRAAAAMIAAPNGAPIDLDRTLVLFYSDACPHCHNQMRWMARIEADFPSIEFQQFEIQVTNNRANQEYFGRMMAAYDSEPRGWPRTIIGDRLFIGFVPEDGDLVYNEAYRGYVGYQNQLYEALETLAADVSRADD